MNKNFLDTIAPTKVMKFVFITMLVSYIACILVMLFFKSYLTVLIPTVIAFTVVLFAKYKYGLSYYENIESFIKPFRIINLIISVVFSLTISFGFIFLVLYNTMLLMIRDVKTHDTLFNKIVDSTYLVLMLSVLVSPLYLFLLVIPIYHLTNIRHYSDTNDTKFSKHLDIYIAFTVAFSIVFGSLMNAWLFIVLLLPLMIIADHTINRDKLKAIKYQLIAVSSFFLVVLVFAVTIKIADGRGIPENNWSRPEQVEIHGTFILYANDGIIGETNTEHVYARSWANQENYANDLHNLYLSNASENSIRGNKMFGDFFGDDYYAPRNHDKGNIARVLLYMYVTYPEVRNGGKIDVSLMKEWNRIDPPDDYERFRNNNIAEKNGGHRNMFIDFYILGNFVQ